MRRRANPINKLRQRLYNTARILGDVNAVVSLFEGRPDKLLRRLTNKVVGRKLLRRGILR
jgi:hypothetical protein